jgi:hypothetical protein
MHAHMPGKCRKIRPMSLAEFYAEDLADVRKRVERLQQAAQAAGRTLNAPPEEPDPRTCCGRGCNPCMYTYYFDAFEVWQEGAKKEIRRRERRLGPRASHHPQVGLMRDEAAAANRSSCPTSRQCVA